MPKYRGDSEDWLDSEQGVRGSSRKPSGRSKAGDDAAKVAESNATVVEVFPNQCRVLYDDGLIELPAFYRRALVFGGGRAGGQKKERAPVAVGDRVWVSCEGVAPHLQARVDGVTERVNQLSRPSPGREPSAEEKIPEHVIVSNIDQLLVVSSARSPDFSSGIVDRYAAAAAAQGIPVILAVTKSDLVEDSELKSEASSWAVYPSVGIETFFLSVKKRESALYGDRALEALRTRLKGRVTAFCGHSGVGKTSLLQSLLPALEFPELKVAEVNTVTGKGKHTTTSARWYVAERNETLTTVYIDTPGVREFGLSGISSDDLRNYFSEFKKVRCPQEGCRHDAEEGCLARDLPRWGSYHRILKSLEEQE